MTTENIESKSTIGQRTKALTLNSLTFTVRFLTFQNWPYLGDKIREFEQRERRKIEVEHVRQHTLREVLLRDKTLCIGRVEFLLGITDADPHPEPQYEKFFREEHPLLESLLSQTSVNESDPKPT